MDEKKSTTGGAFYLSDRLVAWYSKKQDLISLSTIEVEYITAISCFTQVLWMKRNLKDIGIHFSKPISLKCDNTSAINILKNLVMHSCIKHNFIWYHFLKEKVAKGEAKLEIILKIEQVVDIFTKPFPKEFFDCLHKKLGVTPLPKH